MIDLVIDLDELMSLQLCLGKITSPYSIRLPLCAVIQTCKSLVNDIEGKYS